jgi:two-component system phosphate regulon sensor histidine kinase PhoR
MKNKLFFRIFLSYIVIAVLTSILAGIFSMNTVRSHTVETQKSILKQFVSAITPAVAPYMLDGGSLEKVVKNMSTASDVRFTFIDAGGHVLADSEHDPETMENHKTRPEVRVALSGTDRYETRYSKTLGKYMLYYAVPYYGGKNRVTAIIRASMPVSDIKALSDSIAREIIKALCLVLLAAFVAAYFYSQNLYRPIKALAIASGKVAARDFDVRVAFRERDEMYELAENFNFMTSQIKQLFSDLTEKQKQLDSIIDSVSEGLLVVDEKGRMVLINKSFRKIAGAEIKEGGFYWECFMPVKFNEAVEKGMKTRSYFVEQLEIKGRTYLVSANFLEEKRQAAFVLYDISEFKDLERIKKDFVANVSHELRTPLTAIKGFAETLEQDSKDAESRHYIDIIKKNADRLINIVNDLLTLSQLDEMEKLGETEKVDISEIIKNALKIFEQPLKAKGLEVRQNMEKNLPSIKGDFFRLEQVFINLIDNAVKYTEKGTIEISATAQDKRVRITISDTGSGIAKEHLPRIFERFYTADKSRSRKLGGTGLGLSIVKHILGLHNGVITVSSEQGKGTTFEILLPLQP